MSLSAYIPQDRRRALARGETIPDRATGSTLFADISGFTPLTEALRDALGSRRGAEELTHHLDAVYSALIAEVDQCGGSIISFAGDAITCWFEDTPRSQAAPRAITCAFQMQTVMEVFQSIPLPTRTTTALALKVALATGPARRFVVGDPAIQVLDVLAGTTVTRTSLGEHLAHKGEILIDEATAAALGSALTVGEWRVDRESDERFGVAQHYAQPISPLTPIPLPELSVAQLRSWLHSTHFDRTQSFLTEFRPCAVLFVRFTGIDYDVEAANAHLDAFIRHLQATVARLQGTVLQLTIGDKGSYVYVSFGALSMHEDDTRRAVKTALALRQGSNMQLQMGIAQGVMRVGAYGGPTRKTFGVLGDDVNLAARLMTTASVGEILLSGSVLKAVMRQFTFEPRPPLSIKGKAEPLPVFAVTGESKGAPSVCRNQPMPCRW